MISCRFLIYFWSWKISWKPIKNSYRFQENLRDVATLFKGLRLLQTFRGLDRIEWAFRELGSACRLLPIATLCNFFPVCLWKSHNMCIFCPSSYITKTTKQQMEVRFVIKVMKRKNIKVLLHSKSINLA